MVKETTKNKYYEAVGRRKTSIARVRLTEAKSNSFVINGKKDLDSYFDTEDLRNSVRDALVKSEVDTKFGVSILVNGGGINGQGEAIRHGISRALVTFDETNRGKLKKLGFLKRDSRMKERKKPGLKKARKAPQWSKR